MRETQLRTSLKAVTWQLWMFVCAFGLTYLYIGSINTSMSLVALMTVAAIISYYLHERIWSRVKWGYLEKRK